MPAAPQPPEGLPWEGLGLETCAPRGGRGWLLCAGTIPPVPAISHCCCCCCCSWKSCGCWVGRAWGVARGGPQSDTYHQQHVMITVEKLNDMCVAFCLPVGPRLVHAHTTCRTIHTSCRQTRAPLAVLCSVRNQHTGHNSTSLRVEYSSPVSVSACIAFQTWAILGKFL